MSINNQTSKIAFFSGLNLGSPLKSNFGFFRILPELLSKGYEVDVFIGSNDWNSLTNLVKNSDNKFLNDFTLSNEPGVLIWKNVKIYHYLRAFLEDKKQNYDFSILQFENHQSSQFVREAALHWPGLVLLYDSVNERPEDNYASSLNSNLESLCTSIEERNNLKDYKERDWSMQVFEKLRNKSFNSFTQDNSLGLFSSDAVRFFNNPQSNKFTNCKLPYPFSFLSEKDILSKRNFFLKKMNISNYYKVIGAELDSDFIYSDYLKIFIRNLLNDSSCPNLKIVIVNVEEESAESDVINQLILSSGGSLKDVIYLRNSHAKDYFEGLDFFKLEAAISSLSIFYSLKININSSLSLAQILGIERLIPQVVTSPSIVEDITFASNLNLSESFERELGNSLSQFLNSSENLSELKDANKNFILQASNQASFFNQIKGLFSDNSVNRNLLKTKSKLEEEYHYLRQYS